MKTEAALKHFGGGSEIARVLNISRQAVNGWGEIVPIKKAWKLERASAGRVPMRIGDYR